MRIVFAFVVCGVMALPQARGQGYVSQALNRGPLASDVSILDDVDDDGDLDIVITRLSLDGAPPAIEWLENEPARQFPRHVLYADTTLRRPHDIDRCDCDNDSEKDDYVIIDLGTPGQSGQLFWIQRQADGSFVKWTLEAGPRFDQVDIADFNNDGRDDVVAVGTGLMTVNVYLNAGSLNFTKRTLATAVSGVDLVEGEDIEGDGDTDIVASGWIFRNDGTATFDAGQQLITYLTNSITRGLTVTDLNGDGKKDVLGFSGSGPGGLYFFDGGNNFARSVIESVGADLGGDIRVADVDSNGLPDIIRQNIGDHELTILYQDSPMKFRRVSLDRNWDTRGESRMVVGNLDFDGDPDLVFPGNGNVDHDFSWFENIDGKLHQHRLYGEFVGVQAVKSGDLDNDGDADLVVSVGENITSDDELLWLENHGASGFIAWRIADDLKAPAGVAIADVSGDSIPDVVVAATGSNTVSWYERDDREWKAHRIETNGNAPMGLTVVDLDRDGDNDVVLASSGDAKVFWYANDGHGAFQRRVVDANLPNARAVRVADLDNDGNLDVAAAAASETNSVVAYLNNGAQEFSRTILQTGFLAHDLDIGDWNRNGMNEIAVVYKSSRTSDPDVVVFERAGSTFASSILTAGLQNANAVRLFDVDRDGDPDLIVGLDTPGGISPLQVLVNDGRGQLERSIEMLARTSATIVSVDAANLDDDGSIEVVATDRRSASVLRLDPTTTGGPAAPLVSFFATPPVAQVNQQVVLNWTTVNADKVTIDHGIGEVTVAGSRGVNGLTNTTTFVLTATGSGGTTSAAARVTILDPLSAGLTVVPATIRAGEQAKLIWASAGGTTVFLIGPNLSDSVPAQGTRNVTPSGTARYELYVEKNGTSISSFATLTVLTEPTPVIQRFESSSGTNGGPVTLSWASSGGTSATIDNGVGPVSPAGGVVSVTPSKTTLYTLTVTGPGGVATRVVTVIVKEQAAAVRTLAGTGQPGSADGPPAAASFRQPFAVAIAPGGGIGAARLGDSDVDDTISYDIFVLDSNHTIRKIARDGTTTTYAGVAGTKGSRNAYRTEATFDFSDYVGAIVANGDGTIDVVDANGRQRQIDVAGNVKTVCASCARFPLPAGLVRLSDRTTYISDAGNHTITRVSPSGDTTVIGVAGQPGLRDGAGDQAQFNRPRGLTFDTSGNIYVLDTGNNAVRRINSQNVVSTLTVAGSGDLILGCCAGGIATAPGGGVYVTDSGSNTIKQVNPSGSITTVAGSGSSGSTNGNGSNATFSSPLGAGTAPDGTLIVADTNNNTLRAVEPPRSGRRRATRH